MKLYECPNNCKIRILEEATIPPCAPLISRGDIIDFKHIDGMYSFCYDKRGQIVHLAAWTEVEIVVE